MFKERLEKIKSYKPGKPVEEVKRTLGLKEVYKLASNEIPFAPVYIKSAIAQELASINRYPETDCFYLRAALAKKLAVAGEQIVFGNGSDELITLSLRACIESGDDVIVAYPTFLIYEIQAAVEGARIVRVPLRDRRYCLASMAKSVTPRTKIIFIANPDNPTGSYLTHNEVNKFLEEIPKTVLIFFDEAYFEFAPADFPKTDQFLQRRGNIIFTRTFSKAFGLAGLRIGYGVTTPQIAAVLNKIREPFNINRFAQVAACAAVKNKTFLKKVLSYVQKEKKYLYQELRKLGIDFRESAANFILVDFKKATGPLYEYLLKNGVIIRELCGWGLEKFFRVTIGKHKENKKFIDCLSSFLTDNPTNRSTGQLGGKHK